LTQAEEFRLQTLEEYGKRVVAYKPPKVPTEEGNILLEFLRTLIFTELGEFEVTRPAPPTKPPTPDVCARIVGCVVVAAFDSIRVDLQTHRSYDYV
jgi:hypothetical protein